MNAAIAVIIIAGYDFRDVLVISGSCNAEGISRVLFQMRFLVSRVCVGVITDKGRV